MKYSALKSEIVKIQPSGVKITCGDIWYINPKVTWNGRGGVFLFPSSWTIQGRVAFEIFYLKKSKELKISAIVCGNAHKRLCRLLESFTFACDPFTNLLDTSPSKVGISHALKHKTSRLFVRTIGEYSGHHCSLAAHDLISLLSTKSPWMDAVCCFVKRTNRILRNTHPAQDSLAYIA